MWRNKGIQWTNTHSHNRETLLFALLPSLHGTICMHIFVVVPLCRSFYLNSSLTFSSPLSILSNVIPYSSHILSWFKFFSFFFTVFIICYVTLYVTGSDGKCFNIRQGVRGLTQIWCSPTIRMYVCVCACNNYTALRRDPCCSSTLVYAVSDDLQIRANTGNFNLPTLLYRLYLLAQRLK